MDDSALRELLGWIRKTSYEEGVRQTLAAMSINDIGQESTVGS
jgi:nucleoside-diphosphate-sugar epimerase